MAEDGGSVLGAGEPMIDDNLLDRLDRMNAALERIATALESKPSFTQAPPPSDKPVFVGAPQVKRCPQCNALGAHSPNCPENPERGKIAGTR